MHSGLKTLVLAAVAAASLGMTGCASVDDVKHAQATADQALSTAQQALSAAQAAQASADRANAAITTIESQRPAPRPGQRG